jgi:hypothetical protein
LTWVAQAGERLRDLFAASPCPADGVADPVREDQNQLRMENRGPDLEKHLFVTKFGTNPLVHPRQNRSITAIDSAEKGSIRANNP